MPVLLLRIAVLSCLAFTGLAMPAMAQGVRPPAPVVLETGWEFRFDPSDKGLKGGWATGNWAENWDDVSVPHVFDPTPEDDQFLGTIGWYRLRFTTPQTPAGFGWNLRFEGARRVARAWLNGKPIGHNTNPYQPFTLPARSMKPSGEVNELVVRVHNLRSPELREGWWNWGGLVRHVTLMPRGGIAYQDAGIMSDVECGATECGAIVRSDGWMVNHTKTTASPLIVLRLTSPGGTVSAKTVTVRNLKPGERRRVTFPLRIQGRPALWSPKAPNLYSSYLEVRTGHEIHQVDQRRTGLRYIRVESDGGLYLNGHRLNVRGASIQEDLPGRGPALRETDIEMIIADLKALGANVTRAQYPLNERLLDRLDEEGILVWSQAPVYHEDALLRTPAGRRQAYAKVRGTVLYARNHPSVMTHSVANELTVRPDEKPGTAAFLRMAARMARDLDHTVPVSVDVLSYPRIARQEAYSKFGLIGINSYYGWYKGKVKTRSTANLADLDPFLRGMRRKYPGQAMMITEFGAEATFDGPAHVKETFAFQADYLTKTLDIVERHKWLSGAIYWTAREFYVKPDWDGGAERAVPRDALHNKGLITYDGTEKPAFTVARQRFTATPIYDETAVAPSRRRKPR